MFLFSFKSKYCVIFLLISSLTHYELFSFHTSGDFLETFLHLSNLSALASENMPCMTWNLGICWNLLYGPGTVSLHNSFMCTCRECVSCCCWLECFTNVQKTRLVGRTVFCLLSYQYLWICLLLHAVWSVFLHVLWSCYYVHQHSAVVLLTIKILTMNTQITRTPCVQKQIYLGSYDIVT